ncbi:uncharacterized protein LOC111368295 [Olea europaea var. sylvestris]|uniref:uncharacterized protein LOC111368295 n=1 Tax=Olea europaea var. sylvestris TaxID=158386 RepID=UPI000C1CD2DF|nr:uncharacterized protein LOC111368295 [Olea europaea var. sylvestris]
MLAFILIDSRATHLFVSSIFVSKSNLECVPLDNILEVSLLSRKVLNANYIARNLNLETDGKIMKIDLVVLDMKDFDVILGMDCLLENHAAIRCFENDVMFQRLDEEKFHFFGTRVKPLPQLISTKELSIVKVPVVRDFSNVLPKDLPGMPPNREVGFTIDLVPVAVPISKAYYRMTPIELRELKFQWTDKCEQSFQELKQKLVSALVLTMPKGTEGCVIYNYASK